MTPKRGRPYGYPALADLQPGESVDVPLENVERAEKTRKTLENKQSYRFYTTSLVGRIEYRRTA